MVSREEVISAYRSLLGRDPESDGAISVHLRHETLDNLLSALLNSEEFANRKPGRHVGLDWPPMRVEIEADPSKLQAMHDQVNAVWTNLGAVDPFWSVITHPNFRIAQYPEHERQFVESGRIDIEMFVAFLRRSGIFLSKKLSCLELGCGVGRLTVLLAPLFAHVIASDISATHLRIAEEAMRKRGVGNVSLLRLGKLSDLEAIGRYDVFVSLIVLQHNPPPIIAYMLRAILGRLAPGGVGFFQLPTYRMGYAFGIEPYLAEPPTGRGMEMHLLPQQNVFDAIYSSGCELVEMREDGFTGIADGVSNTFLVRKRD